MGNFIDRLTARVAEQREHLRATMQKEARGPAEEQMRAVVQKHWHPLPASVRTAQKNGTRPPAFAVDGSRAVRHLANGAYLFVAQGLLVSERDGQRVDDSEADVQILPGATPTPFVERFAELMMHRLEANLACQHADQMPTGSIVFMDGALYGQLPQLYPVKHDITDTESETFAKESLNAIVDNILRAYLDLFKICAQRKLLLVSIAKTSHEDTHAKIWQRAEGLSLNLDIADSEILYRWTTRVVDGVETPRAAGYSTPVLLGRRSFSRGSQAVLLEREEPNVRNAPAIASFFVRFEDYDDALRVDLPAACIGRTETIGEIEKDAELLLDSPADTQSITQILEMLAADFGGLEVYNALLYSVDREVRLKRTMMDEVYLKLIQDILGEEIRLDRSERRFAE